MQDQVVWRLKKARNLSSPVGLAGEQGYKAQESQNNALLLKHLHKFFNREDIPWVKLIWATYYSNGRLPGARCNSSFWWRDILKLLDQFKGISRPIVQDGRTSLFWDDMWGSGICKQEYPEIYSFATKTNISLQAFVEEESLNNLFNLPLSQEAFHQWQSLELALDTVILTQEKDEWAYIWGNLNFSSSRAYKIMKGTIQIHHAFNWLWNSCCQMKHKVFFWLVLKDRLSTLAQKKYVFARLHMCAMLHKY